MAKRNLLTPAAEGFEAARAEDELLLSASETVPTLATTQEEAPVTQGPEMMKPMPTHAEFPSWDNAQLKVLKAQRRELDAKVKKLEDFLRTSLPKKGDEVFILSGKLVGKTGTVVFVAKSSVKVEVSGITYLASVGLGECRRVTVEPAS